MAHPLLATHPDLATTFDVLDRWIAKRVHDTNLPGLAAAVVHNGELLWGKGYGYANRERAVPVTLDSRFRIASITKTFTAVALLQLRDQGKLRLEDPLSDYLDWFDLRYLGEPPISLYHLLTHTSGLPRDATVPHWTEDCFQTWDELIRTTRQRAPTAPPLARFGYSNLGFSLLGGVVETVSGQSWDAYLRTHVLEPLGMTGTLSLPHGDESDLATGYLHYDQATGRAAAPFVDARGFSPSASFASSANDLVAYARFHLGLAEGVLSNYSLRDMHRPHWVHPDWQGGYGLGCRVARIGGETISGHTGGYKGFLTAFTVCREHKLGVIVLTNSLGSGPWSYVERIYKWLLPELRHVAAQPPAADPAWQRYTGSYRNDWGESLVVLRRGQLLVLDPDEPDAPPAVLRPAEEPHVFVLDAPGDPLEAARFELDERGEVVRFHYRGEYALRDGT